MNPALVLGGCLLWSADSHVEAGTWSGWEHALHVEVEGAEDCTQVAFALAPGTHLREFQGRAVMANDPSHRLDTHRVSYDLRPDGGVTATVHIPELGRGDRARLTLDLRTDGFDPFSWRPPLGMAPSATSRVKIPRKTQVIEAHHVVAKRRWRVPSGDGAYVLLQHPGDIGRPSPRPHVPPTDQGLSFADATARIGRLPVVPSGWTLDREPQGAQALDAGWVTPKVASALVLEMTWGGPDETLKGTLHPSDPAARPMPVPVARTSDGVIPWWHPGLPPVEGRVMIDDHQPIPIHPGPHVGLAPAAPYEAWSDVRLEVAGPNLDRAWRQGVTRRDTLTFRWSSEAVGARVVRLDLPRGGASQMTTSAECSAVRIDPQQVVLVSSRSRSSCTLSLEQTVRVPWGEPLTPLAPLRHVTARWSLPDGTERTGKAHVRDSGYWLSTWGDHRLIDPTRGAAGWLEQRLRDASMPEPGIPWFLRRAEGWGAITDLRAAVRDRVEDLPEAHHAAWRPRPLHAARRGGAMRASEQAWLLALHLRQAKREADVVLLTREEVPVPIGVVATVVRVRHDGAEGWIDPTSDDPADYRLPTDLAGLPGISTAGPTRAPR